MGGMSEVIEARDPGRSIRSYLQTATAKNGSLMALSGSLGAHAACADVESQVKIARFGRGMGIAWQIWDDVIDLTASESATGKSSSDLAGGIITLPVLFALDDDLELRQEFGTACAAGHDLEQFREAILATEGVPLALSLADEVAAAAEREAADVPESDRLRNELDEVRARHSRLIQRVSSPSGSGIDIHDLLDGGRALSSDVAAASRPDVAVELAEVAARLFSGLSERPESLADATAVLNADRILAIALGLFDPRDAKSFDSHADRLIEIFNRELVALSPAGN